MADLLGQGAQQWEGLQKQLEAVKDQNERLRTELAIKDAEIKRTRMPRLIQLRAQGDADYCDIDDVKTVRQRLDDRDLVLREMKDMIRRKPSGVLGEKLRKHEWKMTGIADLPPVTLWEEEELKREAEQGIEDRPVEIERSPPASPGRATLKGKKESHASAVKQPDSELTRRLLHTPQSSHQDLRQRDISEDQKPVGPRQDTVMRSVEASPAPLGHTARNNRQAQILLNRKPVCAHCWNSGQWCDSSSVCTHCKESGTKCVYKKCRSGNACGSPRCLYIHPEQYRHQEASWNVEDGTLRHKHPLDPRRRQSLHGSDGTSNGWERRASGKVSGKRTRSPPGPPGLDATDEKFTRKSVCVNCYNTSTLCDFNGRCNACRDANYKCARIHCKLGLSCRAKRCPCVHPGQFDLTDTTWNVEHGDL